MNPKNHKQKRSRYQRGDSRESNNLYSSKELSGLAYDKKSRREEFRKNLELMSITNPLPNDHSNFNLQL